MNCPLCGSTAKDTIDSRPFPNYTRRRAKCKQCDCCYTTIELLVRVPRGGVTVLEVFNEEHLQTIPSTDLLKELERRLNLPTPT